MLIQKNNIMKKTEENKVNRHIMMNLCYQKGGAYIKP